MSSNPNFNSDNSLIYEFEKSVYAYAQSMGNPFSSYVKNVTQKSEIKFFDYVKPFEMVKKVRGFTKTPEHNEDVFFKRGVSTEFYHKNVPILSEDNLESILSLDGEIHTQMVNAIGRQKAKNILGSLVGTALERTNVREDHAQTFVNKALPAAQRYASLDSDGQLDGLPYKKVAAIGRLYDEAKFTRSSMCIAASPTIIENLFSQLTYNNKDYFNGITNVVDMDTFKDKLGVTYIKTKPDIALGAPADAATLKFDGSTGMVSDSSSGTTSLASLGSYDRIVIWDPRVLLYSHLMGSEFSDSSLRSDMSYNRQVYMRFADGGVRMEDAGVYEIYCKKTTTGLVG